MMEYTAASPVWWLTFGDATGAGYLAPGSSLTTGARFFEVFDTEAKRNARLREVLTEPEAARRDGAPTEVAARLAWVRWRRETDGTLLGDTALDTDRVTQSVIVGTVNSLERGMISPPVDWKTAAGWIEIDQATAENIGQAIAQHVQRCFTAERLAAGVLDGMTNPGLHDVTLVFDEQYEALA